MSAELFVFMMGCVCGTWTIAQIGKDLHWTYFRTLMASLWACSILILLCRIAIK